MNLWTWVLIGLCAAGVVLPLVSAIAVLRLVVRVRSRANALQNARLFTSLESLQLQSTRLQRLSAEAAPLAKRAQAAVEQIRASAGASGYPQMREALQSAGAEIDELSRALR